MASTIIISEIGGGNAQRLPTNGVDRSWAVDTHGTLSAEMLTADLVRAGLDRPKGKWIFVEEQDTGTWAGEIQETQSRSDGTTELTATDWRVLFAHTRLSKRQRPIFGTAGTLALIAIADAERNGPVWPRDRIADETGMPVQLQQSGQSLLDALTSLQSASEQEWAIDPDTMAFRWGRVGLDRSGSRQLTAPRHIIDFTLPDSIDPVINDLLAYPAHDRYSLAQSFVVEDQASIAAFGRRQGELALSQATSATALRPTAHAIVTRLAQQGAALEMQVVNIDRCFSWFREGDTIAVLLPVINAELIVRIMARSLREPDYVMDVSAIITDWRSA